MRFKTQITLTDTAITVMAAAIIYYVAVSTITFTAKTVEFITIGAVVILILAQIIQYVANMRPFAVMDEFEKGLGSGTVDEDLAKRAFYTVIYFPVYFMTISAVLWYFAAAAFFILLYAFSHAGMDTSIDTALAIICGATAAIILEYFAFLRLTEPFMNRIQRYLKDVPLRVKRRLGIFTKVFISAVLLIVIFCVYAKTMSDKLMNDALTASGVAAARLDLAAAGVKVQTIMSQALTPDQTALELSKVRIARSGYVLLMDGSYKDVFNISENYTTGLPLDTLARRDSYDDPLIRATLIKEPGPDGMYLVGVYPWSDHGDALARFSNSMNWLLLTAIVLLMLLALEVAVDVYLPVKALNALIEKLTIGNFSTTTGLFVEDESGLIANNVRRLIGNVASVVKAIKSVTLNVADISGSITSSVDAMRENARMLDGGLKNTADTVSAVGTVVERLAEYNDGIINSLQDAVTHGEKLLQSMDDQKHVFTGLSGNIDAVMTLSKDALTGLKELGDGVRTRLIDAPLNDHAWLKRDNIQDEETLKEIEDAMISLAGTISRIGSEIRAGEQHRKKMEDVLNASQGTASALHENVERIVTDLGKIDLVIDDTNLLAMNSSVISAQAGKEGKGFDVVSEEITKLASVTQTKLLEVKGLTGLLIQEKDAIQHNIREKKRLMDGVQAKLGAFREAVDEIAARAGGLKESYGSIAGTFHDLLSKRTVFLSDVVSGKEVHHTMKSKAVHIGESIDDVDKHAAGIKHVLDDMLDAWTEYAESIRSIPAGLSSILARANEISGHVNVMKTRTLELHDAIDVMAEGSKLLHRRVEGLDIRAGIGDLNHRTSEEMRSYRTI